MKQAPLALALLLSACGDAPRAGADAAAGAASVAGNRLPLAAGFYVATDTPCGEASNATLSLFVGDGLNGSREVCEFTAIRPAGAGRWQVTERCVALGDAEGAFTQAVTWSAPDDRSFTRVTETGWEHRARLCPQAELPEPWRDIDLADN